MPLKEVENIPDPNKKEFAEGCDRLTFYVFQNAGLFTEEDLLNFAEDVLSDYSRDVQRMGLYTDTAYQATTARLYILLTLLDGMRITHTTGTMTAETASSVLSRFESAVDQFTRFGRNHTLVEQNYLYGEGTQEIWLKLAELATAKLEEKGFQMDIPTPDFAVVPFE